MANDTNNQWNWNGLFNWGNNNDTNFGTNRLVPLNEAKGMINGTNIHLNGDGTATKYLSRNRDVVMPVNELTGIGAGTVVIGDDGKYYGIGSAKNSNWQQKLAYGLQGLEALTGLANAFTGYKNYQLAKDQFGFAKQSYNRNLANQAKVINNAYDNAAQVAAGMIGGVDSAGNYGMVNQDIVNKYSENAKKKHVDGSKIG